VRKPIYGLIFWVGIPIAVATGCGRPAAQPQERTGDTETAGLSLPGEAIRLSGIRQEAVQRRSLATAVKAAGIVGLNKQRYACVSSRVSAIIESVEAFEGDRVREGQNLASLYSTDYLAAQQDLIQLLRQSERDAGEGDQDASAMTWRLVRSAVGKLKLMGAGDEDIRKIKETASPLTLLMVKAPFAGTIISGSATVGRQIQAGADLFELADLETVWVIASLHEKDLSLLRPGCAASVAVPAWPGETFRGRLTVIGDVEDEATRTIKGRVEIDNAGRKLKPGMYADVTLTPAADKPVLAVPETAIREIEGRVVVFSPGPDNTFLPRRVKTGRRAGGWVEIIEGLKEGDEIVTEGSFSLKAEALKKTLEGEE
jgi:RND family efflux transporter MFP subunit